MNEELKVVHYYVDEWHNRWAILNDGRVFTSRNRGVAGMNYAPWQEVFMLDEILKDIKEK